ncbi:YeeE/YedE family protein [Sulfuriferula sp.]|uniref:YeeE/YedE family protein n=1 Tax=Sulfuriferula sp. TaxID=2025307 RepID=UPI0027308AD8|nr:YeeE/YedE family protein [Sulfuriferula sp.]MDP2027078.1 YeeE/YedE family protein [Sulfuriferula sp.]
MNFDSFAQAQSAFLWLTFGIAFILGAVVNKTNFCTMGAVSDWVNMGDTGRMRAWLLAIAVAMLGVVMLEYFGKVSLDGAYPPYRGAQFIWAENLLGGLLFGIGMTFASGCGNKSLIRIGGGNIKSIFVVLIIGVIAYFMTNPFPGSDKTLFTVLFFDWLRPLAVNLSGHQDLGTLIAGADQAVKARLIIGGALGLAILAWVFKSADFRSSRDNILGGLVVGLAVLAAWYVTSHVMVKVDGDTHTLVEYVQQWDFLASSDAGKPADSRPLSAQSFTFINPMGQTLGYAASGFKHDLLTFGVMALLGVIAGSLVWSLLSRSFRIEWFASGKDFINHVFGAVLMGFGGVLALGCTIGQGITGVSTLALGSFITLFAIIAGSAITMKIQYMLMMREG